MITKRFIISIILLLTYSLGFAHNFIPHHHDSDTEIHEHSQKDNNHHHHHANNLNSGHEHISHGDHFDEGLYDLLVCFLHETDFHKDDCSNHYFAPPKTTISLANKLQKLQLFTTLLAISIEADQPISIVNIDTNVTYFYRSPATEDSPLRGPPVLS